MILYDRSRRTGYGGRRSACLRASVTLLMWMAALLALLVAASAYSMVASASRVAPRTFICKTFGYSIPIPPGWRLARTDCGKPTARLLLSDDRSAVIGAEIANYDGLEHSFPEMVNRQLLPLGIPAKSIAYGRLVIDHIHYEMALFSPPPQNSGRRLWAFIVGTEQRRLRYLFEGYVFSGQPDAVAATVIRIRDIYGGIRYFQGTSPLFHRTFRPVPAQVQEAGPISAQTGGFLVIIAVATLATVAILLISVRSLQPRRSVPRPPLRKRLN